MVTLHVSVWVEIAYITKIDEITHGSRSTWACELKCYCIYYSYTTSLSRSTWACELKCSITLSPLSFLSHAPRERVSWNWQEHWKIHWNMVTLHVSVWVEMPHRVYANQIPFVTLHVSVWVEICPACFCYVKNKSRSTWACELKSFFWSLLSYLYLSRSTWACELKSSCHSQQRQAFRHAPRERVSWNMEQAEDLEVPLVTLHVSVWVEIPFLSSKAKTG